MMKTLFTALGILFFSTAYSQVIIGTGKAAPTTASVSLEFGTEKKGVLLPGVDSQAAVAGAVPGTLIFDNADRKAKVRLTSSWADLSLDSGGSPVPVPANKGESATAGVFIGATHPATPGILILSDANKAMVLPTVNSYSEIISPTAGMMVYLKNEKQLALYNGSVWTFWKP